MASETVREERVSSTSELARRLDLSRWTVSRVLNGHPGVHPDTARLVKEAISELGFNANPLARGLRLGRTNIVGVCVPDIEHFYLGQKLAFLRHALDREGFQVMLGITNGEPEDEVATLNHFGALCAAGVVLFASKLLASHAAIRRFEEQATPLIRIDPVVRASEGCISVDRASAMRTAIAHLFKLGHRTIATLGLARDEKGSYSHLRFLSVKAALGSRRGCALVPMEIPADPPSFYEAGRAAAAPLLAQRGKRPTAVLCLNDRVAIGLIYGLGELGFRVPEDFSVIGWDNMESGAFFSPSLTTIDTHPGQLIGETASQLLRRIRQPANAPTPRVEIQPDLVVRASTGPARRPAPADRALNS